MSEPRLPSARDWMRAPKLTLKPSDSIFEAIDRLLEARRPAVAVLDGQRVVGIFTEKDSLRAMSQLLYSETAEGATVADHMSKEFCRCQPDMDFFRVAELFLSCNFPTLPVIEGEDRLIGVIDRSAMLDSVEDFRRVQDSSRARTAAAAGRQADRPSSIEARQQAAARTSRDQLVRLFSRRKN